MAHQRHASVSVSLVENSARARVRLLRLTRLRFGGAIALGTTLLAGSAAAVITAVGLMAVELPNPPPSVKPGDLISPNILAFNEQQNVETPFDIALDASPGSDLDDPEDVKPFVIPRGTCVSSHYVHYQPAGAAVASGRVRFNRPILGVALLQASLDATNHLGAPGTEYPVAPQCIGAGVDCGLELAPDTIRVGTFAVEVNFSALDPGDRVRVITEGNPDRCHPLCLDDECSPPGAGD